MRKTLFWMILVILAGSIGCQPRTDHEATVNAPDALGQDADAQSPGSSLQERSFWPDTSLNWIALMQDSAFLARFDAELLPSPHIPADGKSRQWYILNGDSSQMMTLTAMPDDPAFHFSTWELSYTDSLSARQEALLALPDIRFVTEHAIYLGLFKEELPRRLKWEDWDIETAGDTTRYSYLLDDRDGPGGAYLRRYDEQTYEAIYTFLGRRLIAIRVGFVRA